MSYLHHVSPSKGLTGYLKAAALPTVEYAAASYAFGYVQNKYREKAHVWKVPLDLAAGLALKAAALASHMTGVGDVASHHLDRVGTAGIGAYFHTLGAGHGAQASGVVRFMVPKGSEGAARSLPGVTVLGDIPKAPHGNYLSASELAAMAR